MIGSAQLQLSGSNPQLGSAQLTTGPVGTHYCLAVGNDEGLELDETDEDEELGKGDEE